jgi:hypothetical protein
MRTLPIAGALATPAEIRRSPSARRRVDLLDKPAALHGRRGEQISGAAARRNPGDFNRAIPVQRRGVTVLINDSGIDATHDDLKFGTHVVQNTTGLTNLAAWTRCADHLVEGVPNTDISSGHGTHCAGIVGGTGARSNGLHRGVAPGARLVGYGSGAVILDPRRRRAARLRRDATSSPTQRDPRSPAIRGARAARSIRSTRSASRPTSSTSAASSACSRAATTARARTRTTRTRRRRG